VLGVLAARRGDRAEAQPIDQRLAGLSRPYLTGFPTYYRAQIAAVLGDRDRAVELLRDAIAQGAVDAWEHLHSEPAFAALHGYPPFDEVLGRRAEIRRAVLVISARPAAPAPATPPTHRSAPAPSSILPDEALAPHGCLWPRPFTHSRGRGWRSGRVVARAPA
jgi:hypothetical protein